MKENHFRIVIKVRNLEIARVFYRDVLSLGAPVMDSNFWIEFAIGDNVFFCLEKMEKEENLKESSGRIFWTFQVKDVEAFSRRITDYGYSITDSYPCEKFGTKMRSFKDPEGNRFFVTDNASIL